MEKGAFPCDALKHYNTKAPKVHTAIVDGVLKNLRGLRERGRRSVCEREKVRERERERERGGGEKDNESGGGRERTVEGER